MSKSEEKERANQMSDKERLALCNKLDQELDDFINGLERKRYTDGWTEENWETEMDKHPFFMKQSPADSEMSPLAEGLAKLKYDPEENTPLELATNYKEDGNFNFKHKNYRLAILGYTEGIKVNCGNSELEASLYNNRAASHFQLKNYRSALIDSEKALLIDPTHDKARIRAAKCALFIKNHDKCIGHCEKYLADHPQSNEIEELVKEAKKSKIYHDRDARKKANQIEIEEEERNEILGAILKRGIRINKVEDADDLDLSKLEPTIPGMEGSRVYIKDGVLRWPILIMYPEFKVTDFLKDCPEDMPLSCQLEQLFPAPWDSDNQYTMSSIQVYYEGSDKKPHRVDPSRNLADILVLKYFIVTAGTLQFYIVLKNQFSEKKFIESYL